MLVTFLAAQSFHGAEFERYYEPLALMWLAIATSRIVARERAGSLFGLAVLTVMQIGFTFWRMSTPA